MRRTIAAAILFAALPISTLWAMELESLSVRDSALVITTTSPNPAEPTPIVNSLGVAFDFALQDGFYFAPSIDFYFWYYAWSETKNLPYPAEYDLRESIAYVFQLDASVYYRFSLSDRFSMTAGFGLLFNIPISLEVVDKAYPVPDGHAASTLAWFYDKLRFIRPEGNLSLRYKLDENFSAGIWARLTIPLYHLWDNWSASFFDDFQINFGVMIQTRIGPAPEAAAKAPLTVEEALAIPDPTAPSAPATTPATTETPPPATPAPTTP